MGRGAQGTGGALIFCGTLFQGAEAQGAAKDQDTADPGRSRAAGSPTLGQGWGFAKF